MLSGLCAAGALKPIIQIAIATPLAPIVAAAIGGFSRIHGESD